MMPRFSRQNDERRQDTKHNNIQYNKHYILLTPFVTFVNEMLWIRLLALPANIRIGW